MTIRLEAVALTSPEEAITHYFESGLQPILVHAPLESGGCSCSKTGCSIGKHPIGTEWQKPKTLDETRDFLRRQRFAPNVGLLLGKPRGDEYLIAIDIDSEERLDELSLEMGPLPETVSSTTGRGRHLIYQLPELPISLRSLAKDEIKNIVGLKGKPGIDIRGANGQIVVAPSRHVSGGIYEWSRLGEIAPLSMDWAIGLVRREVPAELRSYTPQSFRADRRAVNKFEKNLEKWTNEDASMIAACSEGWRHKKLLARAISLFAVCNRYNYGFDYVERQLIDAGVACGLPLKEARSVVNDAHKHVVGRDITREIASKSNSHANGATNGVNGVHVETGAPNPLDAIKLQEDRGAPAKTAGNIVKLLREHPDWCGGPVFDTYSQCEIWPNPLPWPIVGIRRAEREIVDADHAAVQAWLMSLPSSHRVRAGIDTVAVAAHLATALNTTDLLRLWIERLPEWDREPRLDDWLTAYLGCAPNDYTRASGRAWLVACVERALVPGAVVDVIPVLEGKQRAGKNRALDILFAGGPPWAPWITNIAGHQLDEPESLRLACTRWILHDDELRGSSAHRVEALKSWASRTRETFRLPYAREMTVAFRRALLVGSTNHRQYLHDDTNRRWWPWATRRIALDALARDRIQLLAEAFYVLKNGGGWRDAVTDEIYLAALGEADERRHQDPLHDQILELVSGSGAHPPEPLTTLAIGKALHYGVERIDKNFEMRVGQVMRELNFKSARKNGYRVWIENT